MSAQTKRLTIGVHYEPSGVDPHIGSAELALQMTNAVFDTLVNKTVDGDYLPGLAERYLVSDDQCVYTFELRRDVSFHDGTLFDAAAMKFSLDRARDPANNSQLAGSMLGSYQESRVLDSHRLEIRLQQPYALLLDALSQGWLAPVSPAAVARLGSDFARHPVGTGPFAFDRWEAGHCLVIKRNPAYAWAPPLVENQGPAQLDEICFRFLADSQSRTAALQAGEVDAIFYVAPADCAALRSSGSYTLQTWPIRGIPVCLMMNISRTPTDELAVRQAVSHAVDQVALVAEVFHGEFERAWGPVSQFTLGYNPAVEAWYPFDPQRAASLLDEAGWVAAADGLRYRDGQPLELSFYALPVNFYPQFGAIITRQLAAVGIRVEVRLLDPVPWIRAGMAGEHHLIPQGKYASSSQLLSFVYHSRNSGPTGYGWSKRSSAHRPGFDALIEQAEQALATEDFTPLFAEVQEVVMEEALAVPLHCNTNIMAARHAVQGIKFDAIGAYPLFHDASLLPEGD
jgi:peptide/nickel transport system substrate-binding protein